MGYSSLLLGVAGLSLAANVAVLQGPQFDDQYVVPVLAKTQQSVLPVQQEKLLSAQFRSAKASEVLKWLQNNGFDFVVDDSDIPTSRTVTLNITNRSLKSIANAIATALGGHWEVANDIHVFKKDGLPSSGWGVAPMARKDGEAFVFDSDSLKGFSEAFGPAFQKQMQSQFGPDFQKSMQNQFGPAFQKQMKDSFGPKFQKQMQDQFGPDFQKSMQDAFGPKFQKQMEEMAKELAKQGKGSSDMFFAKPGTGKGHTTLSFGGSALDPGKFMRSLTSAQKDKMSKQGYIWYNDLTREQREMFKGVDGKFDIQIKIDNDAIRVRRN